MDSCTIETGLLRKKPCGHPAVAHCKTCEQPLCAQHAVAQVSEAGKRTGVFLCKECDAARREYEKNQARIAQEKRAAELMKGVSRAPEAKPGTGAPPVAPGAQPGKSAAATPAKPEGGALEFTPGDGKAGSAAPAAPAKPEDGGLEFTPGEKKPDDGSIDFEPGDKKP